MCWGWKTSHVNIKWTFGIHLLIYSMSFYIPRCPVGGLPQWLSGKQSAYNAGAAGNSDLIPGSGRSPGEGNGNPLQCSCLENPMDRGTWRATVHGVPKSWTQLKPLSMHTPTLWVPGGLGPWLTLLSLAHVRDWGAGVDEWIEIYWASLVAQMVKHLPAMQETQIQSLVREDTLEKDMATHSSTLAWKISWTEEPGRLQSMGSQRVGHDFSRDLLPGALGTRVVKWRVRKFA